MFSLSTLFTGTLLLFVLLLVFTVAGVSQAVVNSKLEDAPVEKDTKVAPATTQNQGGYVNGLELLQR